MRNLGTLIFLLAFALLATTSPEATEVPAAAGSGAIQRVRVAGVINPVVADFLGERLAAGNQAGATAFLIEIDTPGGLDTAMRQIIQAILDSRIPVIVYVAPSGARAASAGALITLAADFAAMAPGTNIGAAHPVAIGAKQGEDEVMTAKVVNDAAAYARSIASQRGRNVEWAEKVVRESVSATADEALELKIIDLVAPDRDALLKRLEGKTFRRDGQELRLHTAGVSIETSEMNWRQQILDILSNPTVAYMLLMLGILGIFFEISQPGVILPGAVGAIALLLALYAFQTLPINYAGVLLILLALVLFILEIKVSSYGMLTVGGILALSLGSLMLIDSSAPYLQISRAVIAATVIVCSGFFTIVLYFVVRTHRTRFVSGSEGMAGERGTAVTAIDGGGQVFVHGEYWDAHSAEPIEPDERIEVVRVGKNLRLEVRKVKGNPDPDS
jgi:membrane-bound serine protease (ClpP class)